LQSLSKSKGNTGSRKVWFGFIMYELLKMLFQLKIVLLVGFCYVLKLFWSHIKIRFNYDVSGATSTAQQRHSTSSTDPINPSQPVRRKKNWEVWSKIWLPKVSSY